MIKMGKWIAGHRHFILLLGFLLLVPSAFGYFNTRTNYDLLTYLPESLDTVKGQQIIMDEYGMGAFSMIVVENKALKDVSRLEADLEKIDHVKEVIWYDDVADLSLPVDMLPASVRDNFFKGDATMLLALLDDSTSSDPSIAAVDEIRETLDKDCYVSGMTATLNDLRDLTDAELPIYVGIAVLLSLLAMICLTDSYVVPFLFLIDIGCAIIYNMGSNVIFGEISYITKAVAAVLQLGVTMDYSIFLLESYRENKLRFPGDRERAMGHAIANTFQSITGSSVTTVAGFIALCFMTFGLGKDMGLVMAKGVFLGVITCVTLLPSMVLAADSLIARTSHKPLLGGLDSLSDFITGHYKIWLLLFAVLLPAAVWGNSHVRNYYDMLSTLPDSLPSRIAAEKVTEEFGSTTMHMLLIDHSLDAREQKEMVDRIDRVDGVKYCLGLQSLAGSELPASMIPDSVRELLSGDSYDLAFISTGYSPGSDEVNRQIEDINEILSDYKGESFLAGEAPLTHDLIDITRVDFINVNTVSIGIIFMIIMLVFRSLTLPVILELVIEFAIFVNLSLSYYTGSQVAFVTSIILGTVQLGSTVDYAILMTSRYQKERQRGRGAADAVRTAHRACLTSILTSGVSFFAATFGVALYSNIDVIRSICMLLARGALISTGVVILVLPGMFLVFDRFICRTSWNFLGERSRR